MANVGQGAGEYDPIKARKFAADAGLVAFDKRIHRWSLYCSRSTGNDRRSGLLGSGYAGLGFLGAFTIFTTLSVEALADRRGLRGAVASQPGVSVLSYLLACWIGLSLGRSLSVASKG
jgi:hypothetical protein